MPFTKIKELLNNLDETQKSEILTELEKVNIPTMPKNLDDLLTDEKFSSFKSQIDAREGKLRNTWDSEKKKVIKKTATTKKDEMSVFEKEIMERMESNAELLESNKQEIATLKTEKTISSLQSYVNTEMKDLPEKLKNTIIVSDGSTKENIDKQITNLKEVFSEFQNDKITQTPGIPGMQNVSSSVSEAQNYVKSHTIKKD